jgi:formate/nitrite transporter FocA (FNT family)
LCFAGRSVTDKILAIVFPITAFVALGFEHSVANMYFVPAGLLLADNADIVMVAGNPDISQLTIHDFVINNLLPVTIGNIIGGSVMVGAVYWFIYLRVKS